MAHDTVIFTQWNNDFFHLYRQAEEARAKLTELQNMLTLLQDTVSPFNVQFVVGQM